MVRQSDPRWWLCSVSSCPGGSCWSFLWIYLTISASIPAPWKYSTRLSTSSFLCSLALWFLSISFCMSLMRRIRSSVGSYGLFCFHLLSVPFGVLLYLSAISGLTSIRCKVEGSIDCLFLCIWCCVCL